MSKNEILRGVHPLASIVETQREQDRWMPTFLELVFIVAERENEQTKLVKLQTVNKQAAVRERTSRMTLHRML